MLVFNAPSNKWNKKKLGKPKLAAAATFFLFCFFVFLPSLHSSSIFISVFWHMGTQGKPTILNPDNRILHEEWTMGARAHTTGSSNSYITRGCRSFIEKVRGCMEWRGFWTPYPLVNRAPLSRFLFPWHTTTKETPSLKIVSFFCVCACGSLWASKSGILIIPAKLCFAFPKNWMIKLERDAHLATNDCRRRSL